MTLVDMSPVFEVPLQIHFNIMYGSSWSELEMFISAPSFLMSSNKQQNVLNEMRLVGRIGFHTSADYLSATNFLGTNGTGKTTTIAKIANLLGKNGISVSQQLLCLQFYNQSI
jgi:flagellar biosynthesis GTPase FlhF